MTDTEVIVERLTENGGEDVETFLARHHREKLVEAVEQTREYMRGEKTRRMAARDMDLGAYEGIMITMQIEQIIEWCEDDSE